MRTGLLRLRKAYRYIPTALTIGNSLLGFAAILNTLHAYTLLETPTELPAQFAKSAWMIIFAMIFDMLDGWAARLLNARSDHGMQMDSLADMVTFGVAPAVLVAVMAQCYNNLDQAALPYRYVWVMCAIYLACVALRLALYNVMAMQKEKAPAPVAASAPAARKGDSFHGLPSPGGAAAVCSMVILMGEWPVEANYVFVGLVLPVYAMVLGFLMVSATPYAHLGHWLGNKRRNTLKIFLLIVFFLLFSARGPVVAAVAITTYVISGPLVWGLQALLARSRRAA
jgi:CDP-diacylglycerol--serine O-phosphatidyltransferase